MFGRAYLGGAYFGARYYGDGDSASPGASAAAVWNYVHGNGLSGTQMLMGIYAAITQPIEGAHSMTDLIKFIAAVQVGVTRVNNLGGGAASVEFDAAGGTDLRVQADMQGSERVTVALTP